MMDKATNNFNQENEVPEGDVPAQEDKSSDEIVRVDKNYEEIVTRDFKWLENYRDLTEFEKIMYIGEGSTGLVYKIKDKRTKHIGALKRLQPGMDYLGHEVLEITILKNCEHENIIKLFDVAVAKNTINCNFDWIDAYVVMECCEWDLGSLLDDKSIKFTESQIKCIILQLSNGLRFLHKNGIVHRDISVSNLLITVDGCIKIGDFGLAKTFPVLTDELKKLPSPNEQQLPSPNGEKFTSPEDELPELTKEDVPSLSDHHISPVWGTLWYQAPEVLLGCKKRSPAVDMWSVGCIFGELLVSAPILPGRGQIHQLQILFELLGTPSESDWPGILNLPVMKEFMFTDQPHNNLKSKFPMLSTSGLELMNSLLTCDPEKRATAIKCLESRYFKEHPLPSDRRDILKGRSANNQTKAKRPNSVSGTKSENQNCKRITRSFDNLQNIYKSQLKTLFPDTGIPKESDEERVMDEEKEEQSA